LDTFLSVWKKLPNEKVLFQMKILLLKGESLHFGIDFVYKKNGGRISTAIIV
jgi:hypothetical protein